MYMTDTSKIGLNSEKAVYECLLNFEFVPSAFKSPPTLGSDCDYWENIANVQLSLSDLLNRFVVGVHKIHDMVLFKVLVSWFLVQFCMLCKHNKKECIH